MKAIFFMFLLCCICCLSCSDEQNTLSEEQNVIENKTFEKVSSLELKQQLLDYLNNSVKTRTTFNNAEMNYDLGMQEILRPQIQTFGEEMIVVRSKMDANNIMAFYKENGVIENCLIIECAQKAEMHLKKLCSHVMIVTIFLFLKQWLIKEIIHVMFLKYMMDLTI